MVSDKEFIKCCMIGLHASSCAPKVVFIACLLRGIGATSGIGATGIGATIQAFIPNSAEIDPAFSINQRNINTFV